jgi:hypothetical protein
VDATHRRTVCRWNRAILQDNDTPVGIRAELREEAKAYEFHQYRAAREVTDRAAHRICNDDLRTYHEACCPSAFVRSLATDPASAGLTARACNAPSEVVSEADNGERDADGVAAPTNRTLHGAFRITAGIVPKCMATVPRTPGGTASRRQSA